MLGSRFISFALSSVSVAMFASASHAQESGALVWEEIVVTAQKREERLKDVPIPITVLSQKQIMDQHVYSIADLARTAPSLEMIQAFGGPGGGGQIRGIGTTSFTRSAEGAVGIVVDGVPQGNANVSTLYDIARIEVLRGPQGTLFGLTSSAGVINMATVAPDPTDYEVSMSVDASDKGTAGSRFGQQTVRAAVNIPVSEDSAIRIAGNWDVVKGVQFDALSGIDNKRTDSSVRVRYLHDFGDVEMNLIADYNHNKRNFADPQFVYVDVPASPLLDQLMACGITPSYANQARCISHDNRDRGENYGFSAQFDWDLGFATLTSISAYRKDDSGPLSMDIMANPAEITQIYSTGQLSDRRQMSQELRLSSPSGETLEYTLGAFYSDYKAMGDVLPGGGFFVEIAGVPFPVVQSANSTRTTNKAGAVFGQASYHVNDAFTLLAGLRFTTQKLTDRASANVYDPMSVASVPTSLSKDNLSGKIGAQYKFNDDLTAYATATRGYKGPQVQSATPGTDPTVIDAEIPTAFELGLKGSILDGRAIIDLNAFYTDVKNYQGQRCGINSIGVLACSPESVDVNTKGFEISVQGRPTDGLTLAGGFIYNVARYPEGWTGFNPDDLRDPVRNAEGQIILGPGTTSLSREQIVGSPRTKVTLSGEYSHPFGSIEAFVNADTVYKSKTRLGPSGDPRYLYPAHWTTGARMGVRSDEGTWSLSVFGRNLGNSHEPATLFGGPSFLPPGIVPFIPNGHVNGVSGWLTANSLRQVGVTFTAQF